MTREALKKANELEDDIRIIRRIIEEHNACNDVRIVSDRFDNHPTLRFTNELIEWLKEKEKQYEKELEEL